MSSFSSARNLGEPIDLGLSNVQSWWPEGPPAWVEPLRTVLPATGRGVAVLARTQTAVAYRTAEDLRTLGAPDAVGLRTDLLDQAVVEAALTEVGDRLGQCDALVNAAGPFPGGLKGFEITRTAEWLDVLNGITLSWVRAIRAALPLPKQAGWAQIVNVSAMSTKRQSTSLVAYTAAKNTLTQSDQEPLMSLARRGSWSTR